MISAYVPSLELCKKLRDLGWKKDTMFFWKCDSNGGWTVEYRPSWDHHIRLDIIDATIPAPTVGEMIDVMPNVMSFRKEHTRYFCGSLIQPYSFEGKTFAEAVARTLIHLLENNLVKLEEKE